MRNNNDSEEIQKLKLARSITKWGVIAVLILLGVIILGMWGCPQYNVYQARKEGESLLAHAQSSKEVAVAEAKAKMESASLLAQADTLRAHGIARSNVIVGTSLTENYLHWFWIDELSKTTNAVIYVPTEANIPVMEATRMMKNK
jgi:hypothetical protein